MNPFKRIRKSGKEGDWMDTPEVTQIRETLDALAERRERLQQQVTRLHGAEKSTTQQRINALSEEERDNAYALRVLLGKGPQPDGWIRILTGGRYV